MSLLLYKLIAQLSLGNLRSPRFSFFKRPMKTAKCLPRFQVRSVDKPVNLTQNKLRHTSIGMPNPNEGERAAGPDR
jgi:hypothetical protein